MSKDPAVLWYFSDWAGGTMTMTRHIKGCYMDLLAAQFNNGSLSLDEIKTVLGTDFGHAWPYLSKKFEKDENGLFYNARLKAEREKRSKYSESRRKNAHAKHMHSHMGNENENEKLKLEKGGVGGVCNVSHETNFEERIEPSPLEKDFNHLERFNEFFENYPLKIERSRALFVFCQTIQTDSQFKKLMIGLDKYKKYLSDFAPKYALKPENFLLRWVDWFEFIETKPKPEETGKEKAEKLIQNLKESKNDSVPESI